MVGKGCPETMMLSSLPASCSTPPQKEHALLQIRLICIADLSQLPLLLLPTRDGLNNMYCSAWFLMQMFLAYLLFLNNFQRLLSGQKKWLTLPAVPRVTCQRQGAWGQILMAPAPFWKASNCVAKSWVCKHHPWLGSRLENVIMEKNSRNPV
jgi:hypothetical protein